MRKVKEKRGMKNKWKITGDEAILYIKRRNGDLFEAIVDVYDLYRLFNFGKTWSFAKGDRDAFYISTNVKGKSLQLHRFLINPPSDRVVDHINGKPQDNRRCNIRVATSSENSQNRMKQSYRNKSGARGVWFDKDSGKWRAGLTIEGKYMDFGKFESKELAEYVAVNARRNLMPFSLDARLSDEEMERIESAS